MYVYVPSTHIMCSHVCIKVMPVVVIHIPYIPPSTLAPTHTITQSQTISIQIRNSQMVITQAQSSKTTNADGLKLSSAYYKS